MATNHSSKRPSTTLRPILFYRPSPDRSRINLALAQWDLSRAHDLAGGLMNVAFEAKEWMTAHTLKR